MLRILDAVRHLQTTKEQTLKAFIKASTLAACIMHRGTISSVVLILLL
jgi:hypothetical protein